MDKNQLNRMEEMLGTLIKMVGDTNARLNAHENKMDLELKEIKNDVKEIKEGQERQDRILEMLSVKSIETDSYIRDFKRRL
ncbi:hypothetical protein [Chengkuizengella marina]|uniref:Uncharacterized protein n=1 Tax=Chengkuizengella marina TaxID=2507566 RepID=A0A6N9PZ01_9BACL|nr:hypothetical protein [Chengkuizengella marina]NBI27653.1 hypothetical protein [Chengkuizengella marina]